MEHVDLLYSGLIFAIEGMLVLWTAVLLTAAVAWAIGRKIRTRHCYNLIYNCSWCRRAYVPSFPT
jgi:hypothetical protein